jgi:uncharacterized membrane protein HdeD (DUF308 family)
MANPYIISDSSTTRTTGSDAMSTDPTFGIDLERIRRNWGWFLVLGTCLILLSFVALARPFYVGLFAVKFLGILLIVSGAFNVISSIRLRGMDGAFLNFLTGALEIVVGILMLKQPINALGALTLLLTISLLVGGMVRIFAGATMPLPNRGILILSGVISALFGILLLVEWPEPAEWLIGTFIGVDLMFQGISWIMLAFAVKRGVPKMS